MEKKKKPTEGFVIMISGLRGNPFTESEPGSDICANMLEEFCGIIEQEIDDEAVIIEVQSRDDDLLIMLLFDLDREDLIEKVAHGFHIGLHFYTGVIGVILAEQKILSSIRFVYTHGPKIKNGYERGAERMEKYNQIWERVAGDCFDDYRLKITHVSQSPMPFVESTGAIN